MARPWGQTRRSRSYGERQVLIYECGKAATHRSSGETSHPEPAAVWQVWGSRNPGAARFHSVRIIYPYRQSGPVILDQHPSPSPVIGTLFEVDLLPLRFPEREIFHVTGRGFGVAFLNIHDTRHDDGVPDQKRLPLL